MKQLTKTGSFGWILLCFLIFSVSSKASDITSGLFLHYSFDNNIGTSVMDETNFGNNATRMGVDSIVPGFSGNAAYFKNKTDYLVLPQNINVGVTSFTFATWIKLDLLKGNTRFFDLGSGIDATNNYIVFLPSNGSDNGYMRLRYRAAAGSPAGNVDVPTSKIPLASWTHIAMTLDWNAGTTTATVKIYINGSQVASVSNYAFNPDMVGNTTDNYMGISRWNQDINGFNGAMDDIRFYNRALAPEDILALSGLAELNKQYEDLSLGDISAVYQDLNLPTSLGTNGVSVKWNSSNAAIIDSSGHVTQPARFDENVTLTATLRLTVGTNTYTLTKIFNVKVLGLIGTPELIAEWNFSAESISRSGDTVKIADVSDAGYVGNLMNEASIRTIGNTNQINVLDLGEGKGYFDMGKEIGEAIVHLSDFSMMGYFFIDDTYANLAANGNYFWNFSNTADVAGVHNGFMYGRLNGNLACGISANGSPSTAAASGLVTPTGAWHNLCFSQSGTVGTVYLDGVQVAQNLSMPAPSTALRKDSLTGTICNWLGRSGWVADAYLQKALLYDFQIYSIPLTSDNLILDLGISETTSSLNAAYAENPDFVDSGLENELVALTLGDLTALTTDISLPAQGSTDTNVAIKWTSSNTEVIAADGKVTRPNYHHVNVILTATLTKGITTLNKRFDATVLMVPGTGFNSDQLIHFDFSNINGGVVTDLGEKKLQGTLMNEASVREIGTDTSGKFKVLDLGNGTGYFDMGVEVGKVMAGLDDYTMSAYFRVDTAYHELSSNGNFLWSFSNTDKAMTDMNGYIIGSVKDQSVSTTPGYYTAGTGNQAVGIWTPAEQGVWHNMTYTQQGSVGTLYIDNALMSTVDTIKNTPRTIMSQKGKNGSPYNWIGRSCYTGDVYLRQTLIHDFRVYNRALNELEIIALELNTSEELSALELAYAANPNIPNAVQSIQISEYKLALSGNTLKILNLKGNENVGIFDISGRKIASGYKNEMILNQGIYIVKIDQFTSKIIVH